MSCEHVPRQPVAAASPTTRGRPSPWTPRCSRSTPIWAWWCWRCVGTAARAGPFPGTFLHEGETLADAVDRSLRDKANVRGLHPRQLHVFDDPQPRRSRLGAVRRPRRSGAARTAGVALRRHDQARPRRRTGAAALRPRRHHRRAQSSTSVRTTATSLTPTGCSATNSPFANCGSRTRPSPDDRCSATPSVARWSRTSSRRAPRRSAPEGVRRSCSVAVESRSRHGVESCSQASLVTSRIHQHASNHNADRPSQAMLPPCSSWVGCSPARGNLALPPSGLIQQVEQLSTTIAGV